MITANTIPNMFDKAANRAEPSRTRSGGWYLEISSDGLCQLRRYSHVMLLCNVDEKIVYASYRHMLKTDLAGVNRFLERFDFPGRVEDRGQPGMPEAAYVSTRSGPIAVPDVAQDTTPTALDSSIRAAHHHPHDPGDNPGQ